MTEKFDNKGLAAKIDWEGGILDAMEYGISGNMIEDEEIAKWWDEMRDQYEAANKYAHLINTKLESTGAWDE